MRSMQDGFSGFLQDVGSLIRHLRSYISQKTVISLLSMPTLKSPKTMKFSYLDEFKANPLRRFSKWLLMAFLFGL